ncbi:hypothetical protein POTOM_019818 [Populus tomentosa]|uniref:Uncharacterized protein n=1 Tax=Populus tomentosa TaxID=118781 RepID=A0A8X7ZY01_POPTO|nr:hypothetical protein POTOM_019818 [Populus tomentosa]
MPLYNINSTQMFNKGKACACACVLFFFFFLFFFFCLIRGDQEGKNQNKQLKNKGNYELLNILPEETQAGSTEEHEKAKLAASPSICSAGLPRPASNNISTSLDDFQPSRKQFALVTLIRSRNPKLTFC